MNEISVKEAAEQLGVSAIQVGRLIASGELRAQRFGKAWAVDRRSVQRYSALRAGRGRPLPVGSAWERILGAHPNSIDEVVDLARQARRRGERREGSVSLGKFPALLADRRVAVSGVAAAGRHGAAVDENPPHVVYVRRTDLDSIVSEYRIEPDHPSPNLIMWVVDDQYWPFSGAVVPAVVALVDLVAEGDHRSAREMLREVRVSDDTNSASSQSLIVDLTEHSTTAGVAAWEAIAELALIVPRDRWAVVGEMMVTIHGQRYRFEPYRTTGDGDIVVDV